jgi:hypothetical protein
MISGQTCQEYLSSLSFNWGWNTVDMSGNVVECRYLFEVGYRTGSYEMDGELMQQTGLFLRTHYRLWAVMLLVGVLGACESIHESADFERHRYSQLTEPFERNDVVYFDVTFDPNFPDGDSAAEAKRMQWLSGWLTQQKMCPNGYEILDRRPFDMMENNPARHDIRYEVKCKVQSET